MDGNANSTVETKALQVDPLPDSLSGGSTVLVATTGDPSQYAVCLRILCAQGTEEDTAFVVTTTESADRTIAVYDRLEGETGRPSIGIVDTVSEQQSVSALYGETHIVPDKTLEKFISRTVRTVNTRIEEDADRHTITADIRERLEADPDFRQETTKPSPKEIHPKYTDEPAELWQKPASKVNYMDGSQGFLQLWIPVDEDDITLVSATAGDYDREAIVDAIREEFQTTAV